MKEDPRFVCRREGHDPQFKVSNNTGTDATIVTQCNRCGDFIEIALCEPDKQSRPLHPAGGTDGSNQNGD